MCLCQTLHFHSNFDDLFTFTFLLFTTVLSHVQDDSYMYLCQTLHFHGNFDHLFTFIFLLFTTVLSQRNFSHRKFGLPSLGKASCNSRATQSTVHAGYFSVSIIHQTLTRTTGSLVCAQCSCMWLHMGVHGHRKRICAENWLGEKITCHSEESNLCQQHAGPMLYQLSYIPTT